MRICVFLTLLGVAPACIYTNARTRIDTRHDVWISHIQPDHLLSIKSPVRVRVRIAPDATVEEVGDAYVSRVGDLLNIVPVDDPEHAIHIPTADVLALELEQERTHSVRSEHSSVETAPLVVGGIAGGLLIFLLIGIAAEHAFDDWLIGTEAE